MFSPTHSALLAAAARNHAHSAEISHEVRLTPVSDEEGLLAQPARSRSLP
jgi:hypothetical protein